MNSPGAETGTFNPEILAEGLGRPVSWEQVFSNPRPVEVEIGFGKGRFLITAATRFPEVNYFGIERKLSYFRVARERIRKRELRNVRILRTDAVSFVLEAVPEASVRAYHVYFPDPWWKKRHKKRRVYSTRWLEGLARTLEAGGRLYTATDVGEYFETIQALLAEQPAFRPLEHAVDLMGAAGYVPTNFEVKMAERGCPIRRAVYERV